MSNNVVEQFVQKHMPAAGLLGAEVAYEGVDRVEISAPLNKNYNDKMTAFGGSLYVFCIMAAWGIVYKNACDVGFDEPNLIAAGASIRYKKPVDTETFTATANADPEDMATFREKLTNKERAKIQQRATIDCNGEAAELTVTFVMSYGKPSQAS